MNLFEIVFNGQLVPGAQLAVVQSNLGKLFQADEQRLALLFSGRRLVLKTNLDAAAAEKYRSTLERAGALVDVVQVASTQTAEQTLIPMPPPEAVRPGRLSVVPRDAYMAAFEQVDAPALDLFAAGSELQDPKPSVSAPALDLSQLSLAPVGADLGQIPRAEAGPVPDTSHLSLS
jgi:hypothetical protein